MGRAIDMEKSIDTLTSRVKNIEDALAKVIETVDSMQEKATKVTNVNGLTDKKPKGKKENKNASKEKANDEGDGTSNE